MANTDNIIDITITANICNTALMIGLLVLIHIFNLFGSPPASVISIAWAGESQWLFVIWAFLVDRNRISRIQEFDQENIAAINA
jgi:hypothetical protein